MIGRRDVLAFLGMSPVAGPAALQDMVSGKNMLGLGAKLALDADDKDAEDAGPEGYAVDAESKAPYDPKKYLRREIQQQLEDYRTYRARPLIEYIRAVDRLDPDLQTNRSLSLSAKVRFQAERNRDVF